MVRKRCVDDGDKRNWSVPRNYQEGSTDRERERVRQRKSERQSITGRGFSTCGEWRSHYTTFLKGKAFTGREKGGRKSSIPERAMLTIRYFLPFDPIPPPHHELYPRSFYWLNRLLYFIHRANTKHGARKSTNWICRLFDIS